MSLDREALLEQREALQLQAEVLQLEHEVHALDLARRTVFFEGHGDFVDRTEFLRDGEGLSNFGDLGQHHMATANDRENGDNRPLWNTESEWASILGICRLLWIEDEVGIGALNNLCNYVMGEGFTVTATPRDSSPKSESLAKACQEAIDAFGEFNAWDGDAEFDLFIRTQRDGEQFIGLEHKGGLNVRARFVDSTFITEPDRPQVLEDHYGLGSLDWKYGVATDWHDTEMVHGYFCLWYGDDRDWQFFDTDHMLHMKLNVDREVKRGLSDYYPVWKTLHKADKLLGNTMDGAAIQSAIAFIREHAQNVTPGQIESFVNRQADRSQIQTTANGTRKRRHRRYVPGSVVDIPEGMKYHAGPLGQPRGQAYLDIVQGALRRAGIRWNMPEYMISGDASNNNFASTLVAESPFTKSCQRRQGYYARERKRLMWMVLKILAMKGKLRMATFREIRRHVQLDVDFADIAVRDRDQEHAIRKDLNDRGMLADETWASEEGYDLAEERNRGAKPKERDAITLRTEGPSPQPTPEPDPVPDPDPDPVPPGKKPAEHLLNRGQIQAAQAIVAGVAAGDIPEDSALHQLQKFFRLSKDDAKAVIGSAGELGREKRQQRAVNERWQREANYL